MRRTDFKSKTYQSNPITKLKNFKIFQLPINPKSFKKSTKPFNQTKKTLKISHSLHKTLTTIKLFKYLLFSIKTFKSLAFFPKSPEIFHKPFETFE
jgi:hypothetical protein